VNQATPVVVNTAVSIIMIVAASGEVTIPGTPSPAAIIEFLVAGMYFPRIDSSIIPLSFGFGSSSKSGFTWFFAYHSKGASKTFIIDSPVLFSISKILEPKFLFSGDS